MSPTTLEHPTLPQGDLLLATGQRLVPHGRCTPLDASWKGDKGMAVIASIDDTARFGHLLHVSVSYKDRNPSWKELKAIKALFFGPDRAAAMILPEEAVFVNCHQFAFHLWEIPGGWGMM